MLVFIPLALSLCLVFYLFHRQDMVYKNYQLKEEQLNGVRREKHRLESTLAQIVADALLLTQNPLVRNFALGGYGVEKSAVEKFLLAALRDNKNYAQLRIVDNSGRESIRVDRAGGKLEAVPLEKLQDKAKRYYIKEALRLKGSGVFISRLDLNVERGEVERPHNPMLRFAVPVLGAHDLLHGLVVINYLGGTLLKSLSSVNLIHGRLELLDLRGFWLRGPRPDYEWGFMLPARSKARLDLGQPELWREIQAKKEGQFISPLGMATFTRITPPAVTTGERGWILISRISPEERDLALSMNLDSRLLMLAGALLAAAFFCWLLASNQVRRRKAAARVRKEAENQKALKTLLSLRLSPHPLNDTMAMALEVVLSVPWLSTLPKGGVFLADHGEKSSLRLVAHKNLDPDITTLCARVDWGCCLCGLAAETGRVQFASRVDERHENHPEGMHDHGHYNIPLMKGMLCKGVMVLYLPPDKPRRDDEQAFLESVGEVLAGIMDSREQEQAIKESEARLKAVVNTAVEGIVTIDQGGIVLSLNPSAERIFGYEAREVIGKNVDMLAAEPAASRHQEYLRRYLETGEPRIIGTGREVRGRRKDGGLFPLYLSVGEIQHDGRRMFTGILRDITELKEAQRRLEETNRLLREKQHLLDQDLVAAEGIQKALLPRDMPNLEGLELAWRFIPSQYIGGDMLNVFKLAPNQICFYILDVSGHGVPAALVTVSVHQMLHPASGHVVQYMEDGSTAVSEPRWVADLLDQEYPLERFDKFFTLFYGILDTSTGRLTYTNAGHPAPLVVGADDSCCLLEEGGTIIGMSQTGGFDQGEYTLKARDRIFLYTDGLTEHRSLAGEFFGERRLRETLVDKRQMGLEQWVDTVLEQVDEFGSRQQPQDDISIMAAEFRNKS